MTHAAFNRILVGYDGTANGWDALHLASVLADLHDARLIVASIDPSIADAAVNRLREAREILPPGIDADFVPLAAGSPAAGLRLLARESDVDLIVVGRTHRSVIARAAVGGTPEHLLHQSPCAVAVAPGGYAQDRDPAMEVIAVADDGSPESTTALGLAVELAGRYGARLRLIGVVEPVPMATNGFASGAGYVELEDEASDRLHARFQEVAGALPEHIRLEVAVAKGAASERIPELLGDADMLVMGSRGHGTLGRIMIGSVAASLAHTIPCPLLITPRGARAPGGPRDDRVQGSHAQ